ncbi:MAG: peptide chain release factor 2 [Limnochordales bacterium]
MYAGEVRERLRAVGKRIREMGDYLEIEKKRAEAKQLEERMGSPDFWNDPETAKQISRRQKELQAEVEEWDKVEARRQDVEVLLELAVEADDEETLQEAAQQLAALEREVERLELATLLNGEYDHADAILSIHAGAGGTEAQDWAEMLMRMYTRWAEDKGYKVEVLDVLPGEEAGIKSATLGIQGHRAYGYLKAERGVHRLVRISPFDAAGRRHTSFASVAVEPDVEDDGEIEIDPDDLKIETFRASGAGGQHVNKTESAVRITHLPTGIVVQCQSERSQHANRERAMRILRARLLQRKLEEKQKKMAELRGEQGEIAWGSQIRSYVFQPYTLVKDHRTNVETGNVQAVMDGEIDMFIEAYLRHKGKAKG